MTFVKRWINEWFLLLNFLLFHIFLFNCVNAADTNNQKNVVERFYNEGIRLNSFEYTVNLNRAEGMKEMNCAPGKTLKFFKIENAENVLINNYKIELIGKYANLFQLKAVKKSIDEKYLDFKFSKDCGLNTDSLTQIKNAFVKDFKIAPLIVHISPSNPQQNTNNTISQYSTYLIHLSRNMANTASSLQTGNKKNHIPVKFFENPVIVYIIEKSRQFNPLLRLKLIEASQVLASESDTIEQLAIQHEASLTRNFTFVIAKSGEKALVSKIFSIHPRTGVIVIRNSNDVTIDKLGNEIHLSVNLFEDNVLVDVTEVFIRLIRIKSKEENLQFRFEQPIYAFAVGPGKKDVGTLNVISNLEIDKSTISYAISEGGASYFQINPLSGQIFYEGPLERNAKNYTIKAIAYNSRLDLVDSASVQILIAGIGSAPPQISKKFAVVEISEDIEGERVVYSVKTIDFDPDARLQYRIIKSECLTILNQKISQDYCNSLIRFGNLGIRNSSLLLDGSKLQRNIKKPALNSDILNIEESIKNLVYQKTAKLANIFVNVSVADANHPLEPTEYALLIIRFVQNSTIQKKPSINNQPLTNKFDKTLIAKKIQIDDILPPDSFIYSLAVCTESVIGNENFALSTSQPKVKYSIAPQEDNVINEYFVIDPYTGILRNSRSLKGAGQQTLTILATNSITEKVLDNVTLSIVCQNLASFAPEFAQKFYEFEIDRNTKKFSNFENSEPVGVVSAISDGNVLYYRLIDSESKNKSTSTLPFIIDDQGQIMDMFIFNDHQSNTFFDGQTHDYCFFVEAVDSKTDKSTLVPVFIRVLQNSELARPYFKTSTFQKVVLMENALVGTFIADIGAVNAYHFSIFPSSAIDSTSSQILSNSTKQQKIAKLVSVLSISRPTGTIRTIAPLFGLDGVGYWITVVANGAQNTTKIEMELEIDVIAVSKCLPKLANQQMVFKISHTKPGVEIAKIIADIEPQCEILYEIEGPHYGFEIQKNTGVIVIGANGIQINSKVNVDSQGVKRVPLLIVTKSGNLNSQIGVEVQVDQRLPGTISSLAGDAIFYDKSPVFRLFENSPIGSYVGIAPAYCVDTTTTRQIFENTVEYILLESKLYNKLFAVNSTSGEIKTIAELDFDVNPSQNSFNLQISAICKSSDGTVSPFTVSTVYVEIADLNDNYPEFEKTSYEYSLENNAPINKIIGRIQAYDKDSLTTKLYYTIEKTTFYNENSERRLRDVYFEIASTANEIRLKNSIRELTGGLFVLNVKVSDAPPESRELTATTKVKVWVCKASDLVPVILSTNPIRLNSYIIDNYLTVIGNAANARVIIHDAHYNTLEIENEIVRDYTVLRLLFVDTNKMKIINPETVRELIHDLNITELKALDQNEVELLNLNLAAENDDYTKQSNGINAIKEKMAIKKAESSIVSSLLLTAFIFVILLATIFAFLFIILCYYRRRFIFEKNFLRNAQIAKSAMQRSNDPKIIKSQLSTYRQFSTLNSQPLTSNSYTADSHWDNSSNSSDNNNPYHYSTQEMKLSIR